MFLGSANGVSTTVPPLVAAHGVSFAFGDVDEGKEVLRDVSLDLQPGEFAILTGPSGSGKTTFLTLIGALRAAKTGSLRVLGRDLVGLGARDLVRVRREVGFVFQAHNLFPALTACRNVQMALELTPLSSAEKRRRSLEALERVGLADRATYLPAALSLGQKQRVAVARALVHEPKLILADEPTASLDKDAGMRVVELLGDRAREQGSAVLLVSHDNRILDVADRLVNMVDGRIVSDTPVEESLQICEFLRRCPVFAGQSVYGLAEIARKMIRERYPTGAVVIRAGDRGDRFYILRAGGVEVLSATGVAFDTMGEGDFFGEQALLTDNPRNATVRATTDVEVFSLGKADFLAVLDAMQSFKDQLRQTLFQRQR